MRCKHHIRTMVMVFCCILPFCGLLAVSFAMPQEPKPEKQAKPSAFPLNLFSQATEDDYIDDAMCAGCHKSAHASFENSPHALYVGNPKSPVDRRGCQSCHGPGGPHISNLEDEKEIYKHIISYTRVKPKESAAACLRCHNDVLTMAHWQKTGHARADVTCTSCHQMHWPERLRQNPATDPSKEDKEAGRGVVAGARTNIRPPQFTATPEPKALLKAEETKLCGSCHKRETTEFRHNFHHPVPEGRLVCSDCHDLHPSRDSQKRLRTMKQNCITCHGDIAGPFAFEHDPTSDLSGEGCMECHRPHGSSNPKLLSTFSRGLCNQCHSDKANNHFPGRSCWQSGCHVAIHGSNRDRLFLRR